MTTPKFFVELPGEGSLHLSIKSSHFVMDNMLALAGTSKSSTELVVSPLTALMVYQRQNLEAAA